MITLIRAMLGPDAFNRALPRWLCKAVMVAGSRRYGVLPGTAAHMSGEKQPPSPVIPNTSALSGKVADKSSPVD